MKVIFGLPSNVFKIAFLYSVAHTENKCPKGEFQCKNGKCIDYKLVCNKDFNCDDESDENRCSELTVYL